MGIFDKARVKTAVKDRTTQKYSNQHVTTQDFMQMNVAYCRELVPNQHFEIDVNTFSRLVPVKVPTFGDCDIKHHAFFVPFRTLMPSWNDFITDTPHQESNGSGYGIVPYAHRLSIVALSSALATSNFYTTAGTATDFDIEYIFGSSAPYTTYYRKWTNKGRHIYKVLLQLGYHYEPDQTLDAQNYDIYVSALPLLAAVRVFVDWYYPSAYVGDATYSGLMSILRRDPALGYTLSASDISNILNLFSYVCYDSDYFTSAFDNPAGPNQGLYSTFTVPDITSDAFKSSVYPDSGKIHTLANATPGAIPSIINRGQQGLSHISQYLLDSLHSLSDYMKRHQLVGSRALERFLSRWGVSLGTDKTDRSYHLGTYVTPVQFGAVMSNADTQGASLGQYAGQGYSANFNNNGHFVVDTNDDFGFIMITTSVIPRIGYVQGINRHIFHLNKLDFFTPEFDALGTQPISNAELFCDNISGQNADGDRTDFIARRDGIFGFTPRYAEYKIQHDQLTGDFRVPRLSVAGYTSDSWYLFRMFERNELPSVHNKDFVMPSILGDSDQYDRIFSNTSGDADHFVTIHRFNVSTSFPGKALFDTYDFDNERGKELTLDAGGVKLN